MRGYLLNFSIYLDDCAFSHRLRQELIEAGHTVYVSADIDLPLTGVADELHFAYVRSAGLVIFTYNPKDFLALHKRFFQHPGILALYRDNDPTRDMTHADIIRAISNLIQIHLDLSNGFWTLNHYQW